MQVWLLFVLAAEAPAVAGQVVTARAMSMGNLPRARAVLKRLLWRTCLLGLATAATLCVFAAPAARVLLPADPVTAASATRLFFWAAITTPLVAPNALCEAVLLGAGCSYKYLALRTLTTAVGICALARAAILARPLPSSAWACICLFFVLRLCTSAGRIFFTTRSGFGSWWVTTPSSPPKS